MFKFQSTARIEALEKAVKDLEKLPGKLEREWEDHLNKLGKIMARLNMRARQEALSPAEKDDPVPDKGQDTPVAGDHVLLTTMRQRVFGGGRR